MTNKKLNLTNVQKRILSQMQEYGYLLVWVKGAFFYEFRKGDKSISSYISSRTAKALLSIHGLLEVCENDVAKTSYCLSETGKQLIID